MPGSAELTGPVSYSGWLPLVAVVLPLVVVAWYAGAAWWTRDRTLGRRPHWLRRRTSRRRHLAELDLIERRWRAGDATVREATQEVSATVRSFVVDVDTACDARTMNLAQLKASGRHDVAAVVDRVYPPAFGPPGIDPGSPDGEQRLVTALAQARVLVAARGAGRDRTATELET